MNTISDVLKNLEIFNTVVGAKDSDIKNYEAQLSCTFSKDYKLFLKEFGFVVFEGHEIIGFSKIKRMNVVNVTLKERECNPDVSKDWYVVEQLHIDGIVIWQSSSGKIYQTAPGSKPEKICSSLAEYIQLD